MFPELKQKNKEDCWRTKAKETLIPGMTLYGHCLGFFGRNSFGDKEILKVFVNEEGELAIRVQEDNGACISCCIVDSKGVLSLIESSNNSCECS